MKFIFLNNTNRLPIRTLKIIESLKNKGHWVFIINWQRNENEYSNYENLVDGFEIIKTKNVNLFLVRICKFLLKMNYDCISCNDIRFLPLAILISKIKKIKILYDYKEYPPATFAMKFSKYFDENLLVNFFEKLEALLLSQIHGILFAPINFSFYTKIGFKNQTILFNVPSKYDYPDIEDIKFFKKRYRNNLLLIYAGTIFSDKGVKRYFDLITELKEKFPNIKLILVGDLKEKLSIHGDCKKYVEILPYLPYKKMLALLSNAKIGLALLNPNNIKFKHLKMGTPRKLFTYLLVGLPVVCSKMKCTEFIEKEQCGFLVDYNNLNEIYNACYKLLEDNNLWKLFSKNAKNVVLTKYNWENEEKKLFEVIERL